MKDVETYKVHNVLTATIKGLPQLDSLLSELALEALNELEPAVAKDKDTFSRIVSISEAKSKGYFTKKTKEETIRTWINNGTIPASCTKKIGKKYFLLEHDLLAWLLENQPKSESKEGGEQKDINGNDFKNKEASMWTKPQKKTGRCRLNLGASFYLIADPLQNGLESFRIEYWNADKERRYLRLPKNVVKSREQAVIVAQKEIEKMGRTTATMYDPYSSETAIPNAGDSTISKMARKFLHSKKRENIRSFYFLRTTIENRIIPFFGNILMGELSFEKLEDYRNMRRKKVEDVSIKNDLITLSMTYNFAIKREIYTGRNPVDIKELHLNVKDRQRYMQEFEEEKIWKVLESKPLLRDLADFILYTSMRPGNIISLTWDRILFDEQEAFIPAAMHKQKGHDGHYLLNNTVLDLLKRRKKESSSGLVFHFEDGEEIPIKWIQKNWNFACEKAGVKGLHFYDLKATCLSRLASRQANVFILKRISNHSSTSSLEKYVRNAGLKEPALEFLNGIKL